jgi:hypothetical protein
MEIYKHCKALCNKHCKALCNKLENILENLLRDFIDVEMKQCKGKGKGGRLQIFYVSANILSTNLLGTKSVHMQSFQFCHFENKISQNSANFLIFFLVQKCE